MLGVREDRQPIRGKFVKEVRDALRRAMTCTPSKQEQETLRREEEASKIYSAVWA